MKTLDEVIELCEKILTFAYLPKDDTTSTAGIALFYLREYREIKNHLACMNNAEIRGDSTQIINNPPLTWDELKQMEGKPVWVEDNIDEPEDLTKYWAIYRRIEKTQETEYALLCDLYYDKAQYGETWQVYRKEHIQ